jgi:hypothetical protein
MPDYYELGFRLYKTEPKLTLAEVGWRAPPHKDDWFSFVLGYSDARRQKDDFERERRGAVHRQNT